MAVEVVDPYRMARLVVRRLAPTHHAFYEDLVQAAAIAVWQVQAERWGAINEFRRLFGRSPSRRPPVVSLDGLTSTRDDAVPLVEVLAAPVEDMLADHISVEEILESFPVVSKNRERDRLMVVAWLRGERLWAIGARFDVGESRVCQVVTRWVGTVRAAIDRGRPRCLSF
jgi:hypothetical protein